ncbi:MAG: sulfatase-like hydrolase/transferase [Planctomycetota bacterium]|nr:sulfatase-like hydrolase/transferase [Planctomycetota bacterium]
MPDRPNILLITSDQQHFSTLGSVNPLILTPALDRLCREGTRFDRAYCPNPVCSPTRASIITGQYPSAHGCWTIGVKLPEDVPTVGHHLSNAGYATSLLGKAHFQPLATQPGSESLECQPTLRDLEFWRQFHGPWYGFDHIELARNHADEAHAGQHYGIWMEENGLPDWKDHFQEWPPNRDAPRRQHSWDLPEEFHYSRWTSLRTIAAIDAAVEEEKPFFSWASFHDPHPPYLVPEPWDTMYDPADMEPGRLTPGEHDKSTPLTRLTQEKNPDFSQWKEEFGSHGCGSHLHSEGALRKNIAIYYGMVSLMDKYIGQILDHLDSKGLAENTIVIFSTDHGHYFGQHGLTAKGPYHYEDGIRIPYIVRYPGHVPAGRVNNTLQSLVDLSPTFMAAAGLDIPGEMQGVDQMSAWASNVPARDHIICENRHQPNVLNLRTFVDDRYKITLYKNHDFGDLFDLQEDPREVNNLWNEPASASLKSDLLFKFIQAELAREQTRMPRIAGA